MFARLLPRRVRRDLYEPALADLRVATLATRGRLGTGYRAKALGLQLDCLRVALLARLTTRRGPRRSPSLPSSRDVSMDNWLQDFRYALRTLRAAPGFAVVAALTLGLGIGANAAIFNVVDALLYRDVGGVTDNDSLVWVMTRDPGTSLYLGSSYPNFEDIRDNNGVFSGMLAYVHRPVSLQADGRAERVFVEVTSASYFDVLGAEPVIGRGFLPGEDGAERAGAVIVLAFNYWQRRFASDPEVIGLDVQINGMPFTVVGVAPEAYEGVETMLGVDGYVPNSMLNALDDGPLDPRLERRAPAFRVLARLADGVRVSDAQQAVDSLVDELVRRYPEENRGLGMIVFPEKDGRPDPSIGGQFAPIAALFMSMVGLVLLIACANVANLLMARTSGRAREIAVRAALGAGRWRLVRQLTTESVLLGVLGGAVGVVLAYWATGALRAIVTGWQVEMQLKLPIQVDARTVAFCFVVSIAAGLIAGLVPALQRSRAELTSGLREGGRSASAGARQSRVRSALVVAQVATSLVLLVAAGLFVRSLSNARGADLGFRVESLLLVSLDPELVGYDDERTLSLYREVLDRVAALPGVRSVAFNASPAFSPRMGFTDVKPVDAAADEFSDAPWNAVQRVTPGYLATAGTPLLRGRDFSDADTLDSIRVAIVNETLAEAYWPGEDALGKRFTTNSGAEWEVVGIAGNGKYNMIWEPPTGAVLLPLAQSLSRTATLYVHTAVDPSSLADSVRQSVAELDPNLPIFSVMPMSTHLNDGRAFMIVGLATTLVSAFGVAGMLLATVGLYGVIAYSVGQRTREFGVRLALGAEPRGVVRLVMRQGLLLGGFGLLFGAAAAIVTTRLARNLLIGVSPADPITYGAVAALVVAVTLVASGIPAWRATRVDPVTALTSE